MAPPNCQVIRTLTKPEEISYFESLGSKFFPDDEAVTKALASCEYAGIILATPEQITQLKATNTKIPFIIRHGLNSFIKFNKHGTKNFITCCRRAANNIPNCHYFLNRKLLPFDHLPKPTFDAKNKQFYHSYIHHYEKWKTAYAKFNELIMMLVPSMDMVISNHGAGSPLGETNDLQCMDSSRGTVHIKDGNAVCNAVIRSMYMRTPVIMDRETFDKCYFDEIKGIIVKDNIRQIAAEIELLEDNFYLESKMQAIDLNQFIWDEELGQRFKDFLAHLKV